MADTDILFPGSSTPGVRPQESGGRLINCFTDAAPEGAPSDRIQRRSPGLLRLGFGPDVHCRGFLDCLNAGIVIFNDQQYSFTITPDPDNPTNFNLNLVLRGPLDGTRPVTLARNNADVPQNVVVTENGCFNVFSIGSVGPPTTPLNPPTPFADPSLPANPTSVTDYQGYFVWTFGNGKIYASDLNSVNVNQDSFNTEQGLIVRRGIRYAGYFFAFGDKWTGVYRDVATAPFPFARQLTIPRGIIGTHAIAGWETGWANTPIWAGDDFIVYQLDGFNPVPISTDAVSRDIAQVGKAGGGDFLEAVVYMYGRHAFWALTSPGNWTWEYNLTTKLWNERISNTRTDWRARRSIRMFDRWIMGDDTTGELYEVSGDYFLESADPLVFHVESGVLTGFPQGVGLRRASFGITAGAGTTGIAPDPQVEISWSLDGGYTYMNPVLRRLGKVGETKSHPYVLNCGISKAAGIRYKLRVADPCHVGLSGGKVDVEPRGFAG